jgi:DNA repair exonuclease SbcCD ATPase subunit
MKAFLRKWLFGKTEQLLITKEIDLELLKERLNEFDFELKVKSENLDIKQAFVKEQLDTIENQIKLLKTKENNLISETTLLNKNKELFELEKEQNETYFNDQKDYLDKRVKSLKKIKNNLVTFEKNLENYKNEIEATKESYNEIKERNESVKDLQVVRLRGKEVLIDKYGNFKGFKE